MQLFDRRKFFDNVRPIFGGRLNETQVSGMGAKLDLWEASCAQLDLRWFANMLAQNKWETGGLMFPLKEKGGNPYLKKNYDVRGSNPQRARAMGNINPGDGVRYCGRGDIQCTWFVNYLYFEKLLGVPFTKAPDLMLDPMHSAKVMFIGMISGHFTGKRLQHYFNPETDDPFNARSIVNGDKGISKKIGKETKKVGEWIADDHRKFFTALTLSVK